MARPRKFNDDQVKEIRKMYFDNAVSVKELAKNFNASTLTIYKVLHDTYPKPWVPAKTRASKLEGEVTIEEQAQC